LTKISHFLHAEYDKFNLRKESGHEVKQQGFYKNNSIKNYMDDKCYHTYLEYRKKIQNLAKSN
jgi:hypothetical protein